MLDCNFPTVDPADPYRLSDQEQEIMDRLERAFCNCEKLQQHMNLLLNKGSLYKVFNNNLLYHGCLPMDENGKFHLNSTGLVAYSHGEYFELGKKLGSFGYSVKKTIKKRKTSAAPAKKGRNTSKKK